MTAQFQNPTGRKPQMLRVFVPSVSNFDNDEEWLAPLPSPPPPSPSKPRWEAPYDMQRFDPFRVMMASLTPHFPSPTSPEFAIDYPKLPDSLNFRFPLVDEAEGRGSPSKAAHEGADGLLANAEELSPDSSFEIATPVDLFGTPFCYDGAEEEGEYEYEVDRTIIRRASNPRFDFSGSLAKLATRSSATLKTMSSLSSFPRFSGRTSVSASGDSDSEEPDAGIIAPPASLLSSRRPSVAPEADASPPSLSSPVSAVEVVKSLRRLASSLNLDCAGPAAEKYFEEAVDHYEKVWSLGESIEVHVDRAEARYSEEADSCDFGFHARPDGVGLYARG